MKINVLVIGSGGREDSLCHRISKSSFLNRLYCLPGNPGTERWATNVNGTTSDFKLIFDVCVEKKIDLVVVGPEAPLVEGIENFLAERGIKVFGPSKNAARIEGSKSFAKELMRKKNVPTANYKTFSYENYNSVIEFIDKQEFPLVIKVDGLAAGKGVTICFDKDDARKIIHEIFYDKKFGDSGNRIVIEEYLEGEEFSVFAITDGKNYKILTPAQDYKRIGDGDIGKNTGGMGSYAFPELLIPTQIDEIKKNIIEPILDGLNEINSPYKGCLYCGLIQTKNGIKVIEFNCRFGDPETQSVLQTIKTDLLEILLASVNGELNEIELESRGKAICLVLASKGYPDKFEKGFEITGLDSLNDYDDLIVYHAGTTREKNKIFTDGGRVLNIVGFSESRSFDELIKQIYSAAEHINYHNKYYRMDIGLRGLEKLIKSTY